MADPIMFSLSVTANELWAITYSLKHNAPDRSPATTCLCVESIKETASMRSDHSTSRLDFGPSHTPTLISLQDRLFQAK